MNEEADRINLSKYRLESAESTYRIARLCFENNGYKDAVNRSYYAVFYALRAVLAVEGVDFKRHKDVVAYFNQKYVATEIFPRELGKKIGRLKTLREDCDYDDFYIASKEESERQISVADEFIILAEKYCMEQLEKQKEN